MELSIKKHIPLLITVLITVSTLIFIYGCESKTQSLLNTNKRINRQELQLELDTIMALAQVRGVDLDKQDRLRAIILENALILVQGQPFNPFGAITGFAALYGLTQAGSNITKVVKDKRDKRKNNNG